jgi:phosphatidylserine/phosphatidylglycerophosphate/cardiolipin synthase-like enzyme
MAEFLTTIATQYHIENIIKDAKKQLVLITPYLKLSKTLFERLKDIDRQRVQIILIYGKDDLKPDEREKLGELDNLSLFYFDNLHAKCYFNEECMVITSMNMYDSSDEKNREMGVLIKRREDSSIFLDAEKEMKSILAASKKEELKKSRILFQKATDTIYKAAENVLKKDVVEPLNARLSSKQPQSYCIRCGNEIPFDLEKPLCRACYSKWAEYEDPDYKEKYCHICGKPAITTKDKPQCRSCYEKSKG